MWGRTKMVGFPWNFSETPASVQREAPALGQHTEEILSGLGYGKDVIAKFREEGVIQ
jgi:crotonobetainyl-CoA:carnitine CoA-transferase CaiB-like acyl-CoA transferase